MSIVDVYHVGAQQDILATLQHGSGLKWSTETDDLGPSIPKDGNFYANQHLQICLWNAEVLQDARQLPSQPDRLILADFV